jgi:hypothetical protein
MVRGSAKSEQCEAGAKSFTKGGHCLSWDKQTTQNVRQNECTGSEAWVYPDFTKPCSWRCPDMFATHVSCLDASSDTPMGPMGACMLGGRRNACYKQHTKHGVLMRCACGGGLGRGYGLWKGVATRKEKTYTDVVSWTVGVLLLETMLLLLLLEARGEAEVDEAVCVCVFTGSRDGGFGVGDAGARWLAYEVGAAPRDVDGEGEGAFTGRAEATEAVTVEASGFDDAAGAVGVEALGSSPGRYGFAVINGNSMSVFTSVVTEGAVAAEADIDVVDIGVVLAADEAAMAFNLDRMFTTSLILQIKPVALQQLPDTNRRPATSNGDVWKCG